MKSKFLIAVAGLGLALAAAPAWAHHAFAAEFDVSKPLVLKGTVTKMEWINPHAWIHMDVKNADGTVTSWMIEAGAPNGLLRRGFNKSSLPPGTETRAGVANGNRVTVRALSYIVAGHAQHHYELLRSLP